MELKIDRLSKFYGNKKAVDEFSAVFKTGIYGLLGPNGSGKTTLMRMLCDILRPTAGDITLDGHPVSLLGEDYRAVLGYLPQNFGYYPNFTGWDFMLYLAALKGIPRVTAVERCTQLLKAVDLYDVRRQKIKRYSGGMRQRLGIAQSLINHPKILVLDEPTAGLDPGERARFREIISHFAKGTVIILSTHIVPDVSYIADHILFIKSGRLALEEPASRICDRLSDMVWTCTVSPSEVDALNEKFLVSNCHHVGNYVELRIVSAEKPYFTAQPVSPDLEDLYLYFFKDKAKGDGHEALVL